MTPRSLVPRQNPKYQLFLNNDIKSNGIDGTDADGPGGGGAAEENGSAQAHFQGSTESLSSRECDTVPDRVGDMGRGLCLCLDTTFMIAICCFFA